MKRTTYLFFLLLSAYLLIGCQFKGREQQLRDHLTENQDQLTERYSEDTTPVEFIVPPGTAARSIGQNLEAAGLIMDSDLFEAYVRVNGLANQLDAGTFSLHRAMPMLEIVQILQNAHAASIAFTITTENVFGDSAEGISNEAKLYGAWVMLGNVQSVDLERYSFLQKRPPGTSLEGYLFPDTYSLDAQGTTPADLLQRQLDNFTAQVIPLYEAAQQAGYGTDLHTVLTVASIVEREAVVADERAAIAAVYLNRIAIGMKLEADPTVQYAMGYQEASGQWWKTPVYLEEYSGVDSPYNTYLYEGLPPGPICNPGLESIRAVLEPEQHDYLFFVAQPDGSGAHIFAKTYEEHLENVRRYQQRQ